MTTLSLLRQGISVCTACPLAQGRTHAVPGEGPHDAEVMFVGEAPGYYEDKQARPFVGQAGKFLDELLGTVGWRRDGVYITNIVKCRPPNNRDPLPRELETCAERWLGAEVALVKPALVVTLGRYSLAHFLPQEPIGRVRGRPIQKGGLTIYPVYHPAAALHQQRLRSVIVEDFQRLPGVLAQARARQETASGAPASSPPAPGPRQLSFL